MRMSRVDARGGGCGRSAGEPSGRRAERCPARTVLDREGEHVLIRVGRLGRELIGLSNDGLRVRRTHDRRDRVGAVVRRRVVLTVKAAGAENDEQGDRHRALQGIQFPQCRLRRDSCGPPGTCSTEGSRDGRCAGSGAAQVSTLATPLSRTGVLRTGGFASPPCDGFARCRISCVGLSPLSARAERAVSG